MSQAEVDLVRAMYDALANDGVDAWVSYYDENADYRAIEGAPDDIGIFKGHDALRRYFGEWSEMFDDFRVDAEELIDAGEVVIAAAHVMARMKGSDAPLDMRLAIAYTVRDGKVIRGREYATRAEALAAAGL